MTTAFQIGHTYQARSVGDHNCVWTFHVTARTAKFITITEDADGTPVRVGVKTHDHVEWAEPFGRYSLSPTIRADRPTV